MKDDVLLTPGSAVVVNGRPCRVTHALDLETLVVVSDETGERELARIADCLPPDDPDGENGADTPDIHEVTEEQWREARERAKAIAPLLGAAARTLEDVRKAARDQRVSVSTIYRWIERFSRTGTVTALVREKPDGGYGGHRIAAEVEEVIQRYIRERYLTRQKPKASVIIEDVQEACHRAGLRVPHANTIRKRLKAIPGRVRAKHREDRRGLESYTPTPGRFKDARFPLDYYQVDHTPVDVEIVDDVHRLPIGRPWITMVIDVCSRMVAGYVILLEAPSALSVGLAISNAVLPKDEWLARRGLDYSWPIFGRPKVMHADNGSDFRSEAVTIGCQNNGIDIVWRPVKKPRWGGHIERLLGTVSEALKTLPGATFSNPDERGEYRSAKEARMTLSELEAWVSELLLGKYHNKRHGELRTTPLKAFEEGIHGTANKPGRGLPARPVDGRRLLLDFLPFETRTVQATGITLDNIRYYAPELARWVGSRGDDGRKRKFRVHRDPRAISPVYFYDPEQKVYVDVPYADLSLPVISLPELKAAQKEVARNGKDAVDQDAIFRAAENMRRIERDAAEKTRSARRSEQRRRSRSASLEASPSANPASTRPAAEEVVEAPIEDGTPVTAYEIEDVDG